MKPIEDSATTRRTARAVLRQQVVSAVLAGMPQTTAAAIHGVSLRAVSKWVNLHRQNGAESLAQERRGRPRGAGLLSHTQQTRASSILKNRSPRELDLPYERWTASGVMKLIALEFGLSISLTTARRYLRALDAPDPHRSSLLPCVNGNADRPAADPDLHEAARRELIRFSEIVGLLYEGSLEPVPWAGALQWLQRTLNANWAWLIVRPASISEPALIINAGPNGAAVLEHEYNDYEIFRLDPFVGLPRDRVVTIDEVVDERAWLASEFYRQFVVPYQARYQLGADIRTRDGVDCRLRISRPQSAPPFLPADKSLCQDLLPHLKRAVHLHSRLDVIESERRVYAAAMDRMLIGTVILDETGLIMKTNPLAQRILSDSDGIRITNGHLRAGLGAENRELQRLIKGALDNRAGSAPRISEAMSITRPSGAERLGVAVRAIPLGELSEGQHRPAVAIFLRDPKHRSKASYDVLRRLFELTVAEASLAQRLADGLTLDEATAELGITKNTARSQLRSIFSKTGVTRQTTLVRLILGSVASLA